MLETSAQAKGKLLIAYRQKTINPSGFERLSEMDELLDVLLVKKKEIKNKTNRKIHVIILMYLKCIN